jgi:RNA polymerase sigma-70 factor (ECF subfamily)
VELYEFDDDYVRRLREGDRWTEEHFVRYFSELILIKLRGRLRSLEAIDDVRQEVFVRVIRTLRSAEGVRDGRKLGAFVNSVCNNVLLESYRAQSRSVGLDSDDYRQVPDSATAADEALVTGETRAYVRRVIEGLPPKDADILRSMFFEERDKDEICKQFAVDRNYLRVLLHRAKEKFRQQYRRGAEVTPLRGSETERGKPSLRS